MIAFIFGLLALIGGIVFLVKFKAIENFFFGNENDDEHSVRGSVAFVFTSAGVAALVVSFAIIVEMFELDFDINHIVFVGIMLFIIIVCAAMAHACFISTGGGQLAGRMLFIPVACTIGALMGAAGTLIVFGILMLYLLFSVLKAAASSKGGVLDSSGYQPSAGTTEEIDINVPGEMSLRHARDVGGGVFLDDCGDRWERTLSGDLVRKS